MEFGIKMVVETKPKIDLEKFKEAMKTLTLQDLLPIAISTVNSLREFGEFAVATGKLQMKSQQVYDIILQVGEEPQTFLAALVDKIPEDKLKPLVELSLEIAMIQLKMSKFAQMSAEEKIAVGEQLKQVALKVNELLEGMQE